MWYKSKIDDVGNSRRRDSKTGGCVEMIRSNLDKEVRACGGEILEEHLSREARERGEASPAMSPFRVELRGLFEFNSLEVLVHVINKPDEIRWMRICQGSYQRNSSFKAK